MQQTLRLAALVAALGVCASAAAPRAGAPLHLMLLDGANNHD